MENLEELRSSIKVKFEQLNFQEEAHTYNVEDIKLQSVSHFIKDYAQDFNAINAAIGVAKKTGKTVGEVLQEWEDMKNEACDLGTATHLFGEYFIETGDANPSNGYEEAIVKFWCELPDNYIPVTLELQMYCMKKGIAGTADIILYNKDTKKFVIADYKTNKDLFKNFKGKKLKPPFEDLYDSPIGKYTIQLSMYQLLFELTGYEVESRFLIWLKPDGTYTLHDTPDVRDKIEKIYDF